MKTIFFLLLLSTPVFAQSFTYKVDVKPGVSSGYQRIMLSPDVLGRLNDQLGDMRLYDRRQREVPYLLVQQTGGEGMSFAPFTVVNKTSRGGVGTLLLKRPDGRPIRSMSVVLKNAAVQKSAALSGSPDGVAWYALTNNLTLGGHSSDTSIEHTETISFPLTDYPYLRLQLADSTSAPLNIIRVGSYAQRPSVSAQYTPVDGLRFIQRDSSDHHTYLFIDRPTPARIDRLRIRVSSPALFRRRAEFGQVFTQTITRKRGQKRVEHSFESAVGFTLSSTGDTTLQLPGVLTEKLCIRIANANDPPLQIGTIRADLLSTYIVANLLADSIYTLQFGSKTAAPPTYDLAYFKDKLPANLPVAAVGPVTDSSTPNPAKKPKLSAYALWAGITVVLLLLVYMSYQMLGNIGRRNEGQAG
ncbi:hypothetical protein [Fibrella aquatilis]|uniref:DUF3999 domain-containing protein n=1 Tax=Fibrella aquatilis TaxID=2817059 RepID=A0A939GBB9_9BACT|nr:hypothetical protein [Fibrella aquatilis]MBO0934415.1 hypothetical protein [Fibrella aquatilis]